MRGQSDLRVPAGRVARPRAPGHGVTGDDGYVLIWALFAFVLLGGFAAAALKSTGSERRLAKASTEWNTSFYAAEVGLQQALGVATDTLLGPLAPGDSIDLGWRPIDGSADFRAVIHRIDDGPHLMYRIRSTGRHNTLFGGETTVTQAVTTASDLPTGIVFDKGLTIAGSAKIYGGCRVHANDHLRVPGMLLTDGPVSSGGLVEGNITSGTDADPTIESFAEPQTAEPIDLRDGCSTADYTVRNGYMVRASGDSVRLGREEGLGSNWKVTNPNEYTMNTAGEIEDGRKTTGSYCVVGSLEVTGSPGRASSPNPISVFATGFIKMVGNPFVEPSHPSGVLFESLGDILLEGLADPASPNFRGEIRSQSDCDLMGSPRVDGSLDCVGGWDPPNVPNLVTAQQITGDLELVTPCNAAGVVSARPIELRSWRHDY